MLGLLLEASDLQFVLILASFFPRVNINTTDSDLNDTGQLKPAISLRHGVLGEPRYISLGINV